MVVIQVPLHRIEGGVERQTRIRGKFAGKRNSRAPMPSEVQRIDDKIMAEVFVVPILIVAGAAMRSRGVWIIIEASEESVPVDSLVSADFSRRYDGCDCSSRR